MKTFEDLEVYQKSFDFTVEIFRLTKSNIVNKNITQSVRKDFIVYFE